MPLIDRAHRLMHLWRAGDAARVDAYIDDNGLARHALFARLLQALIELAPARAPRSARSSNRCLITFPRASGIAAATPERRSAWRHRRDATASRHAASSGRAPLTPVEGFGSTMAMNSQ